MDYKTILVHAEPKGAANRRLVAAAALAREFDAALVGVGAILFDPFIDPAITFASGEVWRAVREELDGSLMEAEASFREIVKAAGVAHAWRSSMDDPATAVALQRRIADLVVASRPEQQSLREFAHPADLIMATGLPVVVLPPGVEAVRADTVLVAWKNTREACRAVSDALPFLRRASRVVVATVEEDGGSETQEAELSDLVERLRRHGIGAEVDVSPRLELPVPEQLLGIVDSQEAGLVVAGAYGHSRVREWVFGGVTARLMGACPVPVLFSR